MKFNKKHRVQLPLALGLSLISSSSIVFSALANETNSAEPTITATSADQSLSIRNIYLNEHKQLVVEYDNPAHISPPSPQVRDYPGIQHDIVLEFPQASFAIEKTPKAKALLETLMKVYPDLTSVAYATANNGKRARIRIGVSSKLTTHPQLVEVAENSAIINLDLDQNKKVEVASIPTSSGAANGPQPTDSSKTNVQNPNARSSVETKATKTLNNIRGAWHSSLKAGQEHVTKIGQIAKVNPLAKFKHKPNTRLSTPANPNIASKSDSTNIPANPQ